VDAMSRAASSAMARASGRLKTCIFLLFRSLLESSPFKKG